MPEFINQFHNLEFLYLPVSLLQGLPIVKDLEKLGCIFLWNTEDDGELTKDETVVWPEGFALPQLKELKFYNQMGSFKMNALSSITEDSLPNLERFSVTLDLNVDWLQVINKFRSLKWLELEHFKDFDVLSSIDLDLTALTLAAAGKNFPLSNITKFRSLNYIWFNSISAEIDCGLFCGVP